MCAQLSQSHGSSSDVCSIRHRSGRFRSTVGLTTSVRRSRVAHSLAERAARWVPTEDDKLRSMFDAFSSFSSRRRSRHITHAVSGLAQFKYSEELNDNPWRVDDITDGSGCRPIPHSKLPSQNKIDQQSTTHDVATTNQETSLALTFINFRLIAKKKNVFYDWRKQHLTS